MKTTFEEFSVMALRPALYNGKHLEVDVDFRKASFRRVGIEVSKAINAPVGDTVKISGNIFTGNSDFNHIGIYMYGDVLTDFINRYGINRISGTVRMKLEQVYAVYEYNNYGIEPVEEEITAYKLVEIIGD